MLASSILSSLKEAEDSDVIYSVLEKTYNNMLHRYDADRISFVNIDLLDKIKEYDRSVQKVRTDDYVDRLYQAILENGITEPLYIDFCPYDGTLKLGEGNHRLMLAKKIGLKELPCTCIRHENTIDNYKYKVNPEYITPREDGPYGRYYSQPMNPIYLGEPFGPNYIKKG